MQLEGVQVLLLFLLCRQDALEERLELLGKTIQELIKATHQSANNGSSSSSSGHVATRDGSHLEPAGGTAGLDIADIQALDLVNEVNKASAGMVEAVSVSYIESVKQIREGLMVQEWDMRGKQLALRR